MGTAFTLGSKGLRVTQPGRTDPAYDPNWTTVDPTTKISVVSDIGSLVDGIIVGQTTFNTATDSLLVWNGSQWVGMAGGGGSTISDAVSSKWQQAYTAMVASSASWDDVYTNTRSNSGNWYIPDVASMANASNGTKRGNLLYDRNNRTMMVWDGGSWISLVAAAQAAQTGGAIPITLKTIDDDDTVSGGGVILTGDKDIQVTFDKINDTIENAITSIIFADSLPVGSLQFPGEYTTSSLVVKYGTGSTTLSSDTQFGANGDNIYLLAQTSADTDGDGVDDATDQFPLNPDRSGLDSDDDGIDDSIDSAPYVKNNPPTELLEIESLNDYVEETGGNVVLKALDGVKLNFRQATSEELAVQGTSVMTLIVDAGADANTRFIPIGSITYPDGYAGKDVLISYTYQSQPLSWPKTFASDTGNLLLTIADADSDTVPNPDDIAPDDPNVSGADTDDDGVDNAVDDAPTDDTTTTTTSKPVITLTGDNPQIVALGGTYQEAGASATYDGTAIANPTASGTVDEETVGSYSITYTSTHNSQTSTKIRTVKVQDQRLAPYITVTPATSTINLNDVYGETQALIGVTATDSDGNPTDITSLITVTFPGGANTLDTTSKTTTPLTITYDVTDPDGLVANSQTRAITIVDPTEDTTPPVITVNPTTETISVGTVYDRSDALTGVSVNEGLDVNNIRIAGAMTNDANARLNTVSTGSKTITYNIRDAAGNDASQQVRTITIEQSGPVDADNDGIDATIDEDDNDATIFEEVTLETVTSDVSVSRHTVTMASSDVGMKMTFVGKADQGGTSLAKSVIAITAGGASYLGSATYGPHYVGDAMSFTTPGGTTYSGVFVDANTSYIQVT